MLFLFGKEQFLIHRELKRIKKKFQESNPQAEIVDFDLEEMSVAGLTANLIQNQGLFSLKRMVIIRNALTLTGRGQQELQDFLQQKKIHQIPGLELIFVENSSFKKSHLTSKLGKFLKRMSDKREFKKLNDDQLRQWINSEILKRSDRKVVIEMMAIRELILLSRGDLWKLSGEIDKLIALKTIGEITVVDVGNVCSGKAEAKIFDLVDAIGSNNKKRALLLKKRLLEQGDNEFYIFTMVVFQIRNLLKVLECLQKGCYDPILIKEQTGLHPFVIQKTINNLKKFSLEKIKRIYQMIAEIDRRTKVGEMEMNQALDWLIVRM